MKKSGKVPPCSKRNLIIIDISLPNTYSDVQMNACCNVSNTNLKLTSNQRKFTGMLQISRKDTFRSAL